MVSEKTRSISCSAETRRSEPQEHSPAGVDPSSPDVGGTGHQNKPRACSWRSSTSPVPDGNLGFLPSQSRLGPRKVSGGERSRVGEAEARYGQAGASKEPTCLWQVLLKSAWSPSAHRVTQTHTRMHEATRKCHNPVHISPPNAATGQKDPALAGLAN